MIMTIDQKFLEETHAEFKKYKKDEVIIPAEVVIPFFCFLKKGEVGVYNCSDEGKLFLHHKVSEGSFSGEPITLVQQPLSVYISATSEVAEVYKIDREVLLEYFKTHPEWSLEFLHSVAEKSLKKSELVRSIIYLSPEERIIKHFKEIKSEHPNSTERIQIPLTRKDLSMMTGLRIETVIRTVKRMEKEGKVEIKSGKVYY